MKVLDDCHTYVLDPQIPDQPVYPKMPILNGSVVLQFYEMDNDAKINGTTNEEVLRVLIHRLKFLNDEWQGGKFRCGENVVAIADLEDALMWLNKRTEDRLERKVEGTHET